MGTSSSGSSEQRMIRAAAMAAIVSGPIMVDVGTEHISFPVNKFVTKTLGMAAAAVDRREELFLCSCCGDDTRKTTGKSAECPTFLDMCIS